MSALFYFFSHDRHDSNQKSVFAFRIKNLECVNYKIWTLIVLLSFCTERDIFMGSILVFEYETILNF